MTEFELFQHLRPLFPEREYALLPQVGEGTGVGAYQHCDALALGLWPSRGMYLHGFEIKSHRSDWRRELKNPAKAEAFAGYCNYWSVVAGGPSIINLEEVPEGWGLYVFDHSKKALVKRKAPPFREPALKIDLSFVAAVLRQAQAALTPDAALKQARAEGFTAGKKDAEAHASYELERLRELQNKLCDFEAASGIDISKGWTTGTKIGEAVKAVLGGTVEQTRDDLKRTCERFPAELNGHG